MYQVKVFCGGIINDFLLFGARLYETPEQAKEAGKNSMCVQEMGWTFKVVEAEEAG